MNKSEAIRKLNADYEQIRKIESEACDQRENEIRAKYPDIAELLDKRISLPITAMRSLFKGEGGVTAAEYIRTEGARLNGEIGKKLLSCGYPEDHLTLHYECPVCKDTGYIGFSVPPVPCACFKKKLAALLNDSSAAGQSFADFDESIIPEEPIADGLTQRALTVRIKEACVDFAEDYPKTYLPNLILSGQAGLGKTFLMNCIKSRLEERGFDVYAISAYKLIDLMRARHFHTEDSEDAFDELLTCPLLMIDDLGSEPILRNISAEYLCMLLSERMKAGLHTVISTNLTPPQFLEVYDERVMSRLADKRSWDHLRLLGKDLRRS